MGFLSKFENKVEDTFDNLGEKFINSPISPVQIAKKAEKQMKRGRMVGAGKQHAPTLYTVLVNPNDDKRLFGYYPTLAGETETYLKAKANELGLSMDGDPLVRFIVDEDLKHGRFDVIAEAVASDIIIQLRNEELERYGVLNVKSNFNSVQNQNYAANRSFQQVDSPNNSVPEDDVFASFTNTDNNNDSNTAYSNSHTVNKNDSVVAQNYNIQNNYPQANPAPQVGNPPSPKNVPYNNSVQPQIAGNQYNNADIYNAQTRQIPKDYAVSNYNNVLSNVYSQRAYLCDSVSGKTYYLTFSASTIGRDNSCTIVIGDVNASRKHAEIQFSNGIWVLSDLGSTNGTYVNNQEINTSEIRNGDTITIGITNFTFKVE